MRLRSINWLNILEIRKNCLNSGRSLSLYLFPITVVKQTVVFAEARHIHTHKTVSNILRPTLTPNADKFPGDHHCGFRCYRSIADHIFCIRQIFEKKLVYAYSGSVDQLYLDFSKSNESFRDEILYNILTEFLILMALDTLIKMYSKETYTRNIVRINK
jgi:hypothetical protein